MSDSGLDQGPFVVSAGPWRIFLLGPLLVLAGLVFLSLALVMVCVDVANPLGRLAFWGAALGFAALAIYFLLLAAALAMRVEVAPDALRLRIPRWQSVLPWFPWIRADIPYADIAAVETRDEVYSSFGLTSVQTAFSIATKAGRQHRRQRAGHSEETSRARHADRVRHGGGGGCAQACLPHGP